MNGIILALFGLVLFFFAYTFYSKFLSEKIFSLDPSRVTPAHKFNDGTDFVPTRKHILFGHHYVSIAGAAPIVGPAIAVIWGWLPALLWCVFGTIFLGTVHDFGALAISLRHQGRSIGDVIADVVGKRSRNLFLWVIFFLLIIVVAVFAIIIAIMFTWWPRCVIPILSEIPIAILVALLIHKAKVRLELAALLALSLMFITIYIGVQYPIEIPPIIGSVKTTWIVIWLCYAFIASILPVWLLLQSRDFINSHELYVLLGLLYAGLFVAGPTVVAPAVQLHPEGASLIFPMLFITIACGAISGFHSLVSSGLTSKQLDNERDARAIGYGGMVGEGILSVMAVIVCTAGFATAALWKEHYASWGAAAGLGSKIDVFVVGGAGFLKALGIPEAYAITLIAVLLLSFAITTIDSATRLLRYTISEIGSAYKVEILGNSYVASAIGVTIGGILALWKYGGKETGLLLWPIFGTTNQLLAALALMVLTVWLFKSRKPTIYTGIPMVFMIGVTLSAMVYNLGWYYIPANNILLTVLGLIILALTIWLIFETIYALKGERRQTE